MYNTIFSQCLAATSMHYSFVGFGFHAFSIVPVSGEHDNISIIYQCSEQVTIFKASLGTGLHLANVSGDGKIQVFKK